jgi:hypothetical protein
MALEVLRTVEFEYEGDRYRAKVWSTKRGDSKAEQMTDEQIIEHKKRQIDRFKLHKIKISYKI